MGKCILLCEDSPEIQEVTKFILESKGYYVDIIDDGEKVMDEIHDHPPDLILLDLGLPNVNGKELTRQIKSDIDTKDIPVLLFSAHANLPTIAAESGADGYISKPFDLVLLEKTVDKAISEHPT